MPKSALAGRQKTGTSARLPSGSPFATEGKEGFPDMSRFDDAPSQARGAIQLPDKEFRYLRTVIFTAAVYRGFDHKLRPKTNLIN